MGLIYKITNNLNGLSYIGKTSRSLQTRIGEHKRSCDSYLATGNNNIPLYNAIGKYGWNNFSIDIIEDDIDLEFINEKEQFYIEKYQTYLNGYNATTGGDGGRTSSKLNEKEIEQIIAILLDENNLLSFRQIAKIFNIHPSVISTINSGESWHNSKLNYPLRKYNTLGLSISKKEYQTIVDQIKNSTKTLNEIAKEYHLSEEQMTAINNGYECYNGQHSYYKNIYDGPFPIRNTNKKLEITEDTMKEILYDILFTKNSMAKIGEKYSISGNSLTYIANGKRRKELTKNYIVPLRNNLMVNQKIYNEFYQKEGR